MKEGTYLVLGYEIFTCTATFPSLDSKQMGYKKSTHQQCLFPTTVCEAYHKKILKTQTKAFFDY